MRVNLLFLIFISVFSCVKLIAPVEYFEMVFCVEIKDFDSKIVLSQPWGHRIEPGPDEEVLICRMSDNQGLQPLIV